MALALIKHQAFQLHISLQDLDPMIWRRVRVTGAISLDQLHLLIQIAMGWDDAHLYAFRIGGTSYSVPERGTDSRERDARRALLGELGLRIRSRFQYEYDFGDSWMHDIRVEKVETVDELVLPECLEGQHACPPEDCGGPDGYVNLVHALFDKDHPDHAHYMEWIGDPFDPFEFNVEKTNNLLKATFRPAKPRKKKAPGPRLL